MSKITFYHNFLWVNFRRNFTFLLGLCLSIFIFNLNASAVFALHTPTLSASVSQTNLQVNGNQVINSTDKTTEIPLNLTVNTNNKTGYTATLNSETDETALVNNGSSTNAKINSISSTGQLGDFSNNTWGYKFGTSTNYAPIPALSTPAQILQTSGKTNGNESNQLSIGMKLSDNLESGRYTNKLIFSILTNNYEHIAIMTEGIDFNGKIRSLETTTNKIEHFKKSSTPPATTANAKNIEDEDSDYEIKLWLDPTDKTAYYYAEPEKVYLNENSGGMFYREDTPAQYLDTIGNWFDNIRDIDLSNFDTSRVTDMHYMFWNMHSLTSLDLSSFDTSKVTNMSSMFDNTGLTSLNLSNFDTSKVTNMSRMFAFMRNLTTLDLSNFDTSKVTDMNAMFMSMWSLTSLNISNFDTSKVTNMSSMFDNTGLTSLNLSNFDTSKVTNMSRMFAFMRNLTTLDLSNFDTSKVTDMNAMFMSMWSLTSLNISNFDTSKVTNMGYMFEHMSSLTTLNLSNFDTSRVTYMFSMFEGMSNLTTLDLSNFDTSKVTNMSRMFYNMRNLTTLDLSNFDTSNVTDMESMFYLLRDDIPRDKLEKIYVNNDFDTYKLRYSTDMFGNRKKLRGGNGSYLTNPSTANRTWLRVDRPGVQGYFTRKS